MPYYCQKHGIHTPTEDSCHKCEDQARNIRKLITNLEMMVRKSANYANIGSYTLACRIYQLAAQAKAKRKK